MREQHVARNSAEKETALSHTYNDVVHVLASETLEETRRRLMSRRFAVSDVVIVTDQHGRYLGIAETADVLSQAGVMTIEEIFSRDWAYAAPDLDQERAVEMAAAAGITTLPVVAEDGRPLGCIPAKALMQVMADEHHEDVHRMAGILRQNAYGREALDGSPLHRFARRMPWLLTGLILSTAGTVVMARFEKTLSSNIAIAFFIPALVYLADAIGTQTEAIAVRGLSLTEDPFPKVLLREAATGGLIGASLGALAVLGVWAVFGDWRLAVGVGISLFAAGTLASAIGLTLPWALKRLGIDPALGSGPLATIVQDVLTLLVYFVVIGALLPVRTE